MTFSNTAILGLQWGDEGKGKIVNFLAGNFGAACRYQGGHNAGHTLIIDGKKNCSSFAAFINLPQRLIISNRKRRRYFL